MTDGLLSHLQVCDGFLESFAATGRQFLSNLNFP